MELVTNLMSPENENETQRKWIEREWRNVAIRVEEKDY